MRNKLKYKNKLTFLGALRKRFHEITNWSYEEIVIVKLPINIESYKYLYRHIVKINKSFKGNLSLSLNKSEYAGEEGYTAVIKLKVIK